MIEIQISPEQYQKAREVIRTAKEVRSFTEEGASAGSLSTDQVALEYVFDGDDLHVKVTAKHGMAKFASEDMIKSKLMQLLAVA